MTGRRWAVAAVAVLLVAIGAGGAWRLTQESEDTEGAGPPEVMGDGAVGAGTEPTEAERFGWALGGAFDGEELVVVGNRRPVGDDPTLGPHNRFVVDNGPWAYDPVEGTWRDLPPLGLDHPLVGASVHASRLGTIVSGVSCGVDSPGFTDGVDDVDEQHGRPPLDCRPGTPAAAIRWAGEDRFQPLALPGGQEARAILVSGGPSGDLIAVRGGHVLRLERDGTWEPLVAPTDGVAEACPVGDRVVALGRPPRRPDGSVGEFLLTELEPGATAWERIPPLTDQLPRRLICGAGVALVELSGAGDDSLDQSFQILRADGGAAAVALPEPPPPGSGTELVQPGGRLESPSWDGHGFVARSSGVLDLEAGAIEDQAVYVLDVDESAWRPAAAGSLDLRTYADVVALDGKVALYRLQEPWSMDSPGDQRPPRWEVAPVLEPA